jgi:molybdopterin/thiamine biosynthesis adenylyltransferase
MSTTQASAGSQLTDYDRIRYNRQMMIWDWGEAGQARLTASRVFIAGAGGLGSPVAIYLAAAGVGHISIVDADRVELSNLNRQILHSDGRIGHLKSASAEQSLQELNPSVRIEASSEYLDESSVASLVAQPDIVVDCLDNYATRYVLNRYAVGHNIPFMHGAIWGMTGQITFLRPPLTPCLRCLVPEPPPKETFPVLGATPGVIGCLQAMEVLKYLTGVGSPLAGRLLIFDGEEMVFRVVQIRRDPACPECGHL